MWRTLIPADGAVVACDGRRRGRDGVLPRSRLTVPGGAVLPMAGVSWVCVAPTHRRRGVLAGCSPSCTAGCRRLSGRRTRGVRGRHLRPVRLRAGECRRDVTVDRRGRRFLDEVPDPGGVRIVGPREHRDQIEEIYERWRLRTPGGLLTPAQMWDEVFGDREVSRHGGSPLLVLLHDDGFAFYRVHGDGERKSVVVIKLAAVTDDAYVALWRTLLGMDLMDTVTIDAPPGELLPYLLTDARAGSRHRHRGRAVAADPRRADGARRRAPTRRRVRGARRLGRGARRRRPVRPGHPGRPGAMRAQRRRARRVADLSVLGSLYLGAHRASAFAAANRLRCNDSGVIALLDAAFASDVPAELGFGF